MLATVTRSDYARWQYEQRQGQAGGRRWRFAARRLRAMGGVLRFRYGRGGGRDSLVPYSAAVGVKAEHKHSPDGFDLPKCIIELATHDTRDDIVGRAHRDRGR